MFGTVQRYLVWIYRLLKPTKQTNASNIFLIPLTNSWYILYGISGETALQMAIVNEDPAMVKFLLDNGADVHQRAVGNFFTADDQKSGRKDSFEHEWFDLPMESNYEG